MPINVNYVFFFFMSPFFIFFLFFSFLRSFSLPREVIWISSEISKWLERDILFIHVQSSRIHFSMSLLTYIYINYIPLNFGVDIMLFVWCKKHMHRFYSILVQWFFFLFLYVKCYAEKDLPLRINSNEVGVESHATKRIA